MTSDDVCAVKGPKMCIEGDTSHRRQVGLRVSTSRLSLREELLVKLYLTDLCVFYCVT